MDTMQRVRQLLEDEVARDAHAVLFRAPLVGVSAASDPAYTNIKETVGHHHAYPWDILPEVKIVISFFIPFAPALVKENRTSGEVPESWAQAYEWCNDLINRAAQRVADDFVAHGVPAATVPATHGFDKNTLMAVWSHRSAACIAGLGRFGANNMLITEKGGAGRYGTVFTAELLPAEPGNAPERCLHNRGKSCRYCVDNCPTGALTFEGFDRHKCHAFLKTQNARFPHLGSTEVCGKCAVGPCAILQA